MPMLSVKPQMLLFRGVIPQNLPYCGSVTSTFSWRAMPFCGICVLFVFEVKCRILFYGRLISADIAILCHPIIQKKLSFFLSV